MEVRELKLGGLRVVYPDVFADDRGFFLEPYNAARYRTIGIVEQFVQDNHSRSTKGTLRGLHYQGKPGQAKLVSVVVGTILDVAVDIRVDSPTFGQWEAVELTAERHEQLYVPVGFAHGFCVTSDVAEVMYKVSSLYDANEERTIAWNDPDIGVRWSVLEPLLSKRDKAGESFADYRKRLSP